MKKKSENYAELIMHHPLFCLLDLQSAHQLIRYFKSEFVEPQQVIVVDGDPIDCIYLIISGRAEVIRSVHTLGNHREMRIDELRTGDFIGLSSEGFSSRTGLRTASVKALTTMHLLKISLYDFLQFLQQPQIRYPNLKKLSEEFLLIQFIRSHHTFRNLSHEKIETIVKTARHIKISEGTCLYKEGDIADTVYYLLNGEVILLNLKKSSSTVVKINQMFGEEEFLTKMKRKESAYAKSDSEVLIMEAEIVNKLINVEHSSSLFQKVISRLRRNK
ncbi:cyclic nucleotide-binding domain-containing protein [Legionella longbeachae]|uniref:Putative cyclic nucleotide-binding protein n=1 Tax=Legionella longbeachae serogroup 1 (strain NSW150) TaxID=661367 RepID=D3HJU4_LEGLN|nr:cyclic nucleotide-binding domain-containing protein [Legionella longbeachae]VEE03224.1 cyclic nucleotide-binding protein [Legionella oakridgensis]HBD7398605.1 cyclic nucleotide-binding domain-containing protein [Legionella pneumophila]ARB93879.1 cyclic nucleotide-binding domain-containing protein [Legionella longbeachae]ARM32982.1 cyclic nucleotide-binding domain-containing protein [Legionella longbeachae]QIN32944.1 cyclic nucleotide-binding domain-containing protein [Legionella longbeachae